MNAIAFLSVAGAAFLTTLACASVAGATERVAVTPLAVQKVVTSRPAETLLERPLTQRIFERPIIEKVVGRPAVERVVEQPIVQRVVARPVVDEIVEGPAFEKIVTRQVVEKTVECSTRDPFVQAVGITAAARRSVR